MFNMFYLTGMIVLLGALIYFYVKSRSFTKENTYFQAIMDNLPTFVYLKDTSGKIIKANETLCKMLNCKKKDVEGKYSNELYLKNYKEMVNEEDQTVILEHKSICVKRLIEINEGDPHWYNVMKSPVYDNKNKLSGIFVRLENIDEEKDIEDKKENFVATLTHDLKSPASSQYNGLTMLLNGSFGALTPIQSEMIELIRCSCNYMSELIATILDTYIYDNGIIKLSPTEFDIAALIEKLKKGMNHTLQDKKLTFIVKNELETNFIVADRLQLKRVIMNLVSNANTYSKNNSEILIQLKSEQGMFIFNVINHCKFVPTEGFDNVFEKFSTLGNSKLNKTSTGLGLYLSKQIIEYHNGEIYAQMLDNDMCKFGFKVPMKAAVVSA